MAEESEDFWLEGHGEGENGILQNCETLMDINTISEGNHLSQKEKKVFNDVLPCHKELLMEHAELREEMKKALALINEKEESLSIIKQGTEKQLEDYNEEQIKYEEKLKYQKDEMTRLDKKICYEKKELETIKKICERDHQETIRTEKEVLDFQKNLTKSRTNGAFTDQRISMLLQQFDDLSDMSVNYFEGTVVSVSILGKQDNGSAKKQLEVILSFFEHAHNNLSGVEVTTDQCSYDDLIRTALTERLGAVWLLKEIKRRFKSTYGIDYEIATLQTRYAMDWEADERLVTVMIPGKKASTCRLRIPVDYPSNQTIVCVYADQNLDGIIADIQSEVRNNRMFGLTQWLEYLHQTS